mgnify:CR=1 FL=1
MWIFISFIIAFCAVMPNAEAATPPANKHTTATRTGKNRVAVNTKRTKRNDSLNDAPVPMPNLPPSSSSSTANSRRLKRIYNLRSWKKPRLWWSSEFGAYSYSYKTDKNNKYPFAGPFLGGRLGYASGNWFYSGHLLLIMDEDSSAPDKSGWQLGGSVGYALAKYIVLEGGMGFHWISDDFQNLPIIQVPLEIGATLRFDIGSRLSLGIRIVGSLALDLFRDATATALRVSLVFESL